FFSSRRRHTRSKRDWSSDVCSSDLPTIYLRARPSRFLTAEAVITACCTKWSFIRANALCPARKAIRRRMRESGKTIAKSSRKGRSEERRVGKERREREGRGRGEGRG